MQGNLTVDLIMVCRDDFDDCRLDETAAEIKARNVKQFSYMPVADGKGGILGLYNAERWFARDAPAIEVRCDFEQLSEDILIGADASIIDFIRQAVKHPTNLVVSGSRIEGLVSLSDIQQLPARAAIFTLITSLEMAMALAISLNWPESCDWMFLLSSGRQVKLREEIKRAEQKDAFVSEIALTQLHDKSTIIGNSKLLDDGSSNFESDFKGIKKLRNDVAHANAYADSPAKALAVCAEVRRIFEIKVKLLGVIENLRAQTA